MKKTRYILISFVFVALLSACGSVPQTGKEIAPFSYTDQDGQSFGTVELEGKVWIADFIFTNCNTVCPTMSAEMATLQKKFNEEGIQVEFVSFTVDPKVDSPDVLKNYIQRFSDDETNWHMLTGYSQNEIEVFAREQFQTIIQKPESSHQVIHGTNFYLVDEQGVSVNEFNYVDSSYIEDMKKVIEKIQR
ncbi:SCO family protein [Sporosarcina sp. JAI121]|uniref:SCO family protein n=1 Tax=Sporosarcina sp. JAI121 TaxID=2723064 RepID=UPI0015CD6CF9|nr:SCO family protein [Sporosarcina sp. JAI121]NYF25318.1 protein SCO1/2 [Sporosarcina sp. JAI121]